MFAPHVVYLRSNIGVFVCCVYMFYFLHVIYEHMITCYKWTVVQKKLIKECYCYANVSKSCFEHYDDAMLLVMNNVLGSLH